MLCGTCFYKQVHAFMFHLKINVVVALLTEKVHIYSSCSKLSVITEAWCVASDIDCKLYFKADPDLPGQISPKVVRDKRMETD